MVCTLPSSLTVSSPLWAIAFETYSGYDATITLVVTPGFKTKLSSFLQSLVPYLSKKKPELTALLDKAMLMNATPGDLRGSMVSPYCPGKIAPRLSWFGNFNIDFEFIWILLTYHWHKKLIKILRNDVSEKLSNQLRIQVFGLHWLTLPIKHEDLSHYSMSLFIVTCSLSSCCQFASNYR